MSNKEKAKKEAAKIELEKTFYFENIQRLHKQATESISNWSITVIEERLSKLMRDFKSMETKCKQVLCAEELGEEAKKASQSELNEAESVMYDLIDKLKSRMTMLQEKRSETTEPSEMQQKSDDSKAEKASEKKSDIVHYKVRKFAGKTEDWKAFEAWLNELGNQSKIDDAAKIEIVRQACAGGGAEKVVAQASDFGNARQKLRNIFGRKYKQTQSVFRKVSNITPIANASSDSLTQLLLEANKCVEMFGELEVAYDEYTTCTVIDKLDHQTTLAWERTVKAASESYAEIKDGIKREASDFLPNWQMLKEFLTSEAELMLADETQAYKFQLNASTPKESQSKSYAEQTKAVPTTSNASQNLQQTCERSTGFGCFLCNGQHIVLQCDKFRDEYDYLKRTEMCNTRKWCHQCIHPVHTGSPCKDPKCREPCPKCGPSVFHNSLLCPNAYKKPSVSVAPVPKPKRKDEDDWDDEN